METINFIYKSKVEQFKEQFPELFMEIYDIGYIDGRTSVQYQYDAENPAEFDEGMGENEPSYPQYAVPTDDSERFSMFGTWQEVYNKAKTLNLADYKAGNKDWRAFMDSYKSWTGKIMYIAWNPTHKQFAVESDASIIDECYPHLVNPQEKDI